MRKILLVVLAAFCLAAPLTAAPVWQELTAPEFWPSEFTILSGIASNGGFNTISMDSTGDFCGAIFRASKSTVLTHVGIGVNDSAIGFRWQAHESLHVRLETVSANGERTGTLFGTNTFAAIARPTPYSGNIGEIWAPLVANATVAIGDRIGIIVVLTSDTMQVVVRRGIINASVFMQCDPYQIYRTASTISTDDEYPTFGIRATWDTLVWAGMVAIDTFYQVTMDSAGCISNCFSMTFDEIGNLLVAEKPAKVCGAWVTIRNDATSGITMACSIKAYKGSAGTTLLGKAVMNDIRATALRGVRKVCWEDTSFQVAVGDTVRLTMVPFNGNNVSEIIIAKGDFKSDLQWLGARNWYLTYRDDASQNGTKSAWTEDTTRAVVGLGFLHSAVVISSTSEDFGRRRKILQMGWLRKESTEEFAGAHNAEVER